MDIGIKGLASVTVTEELTAARVGSGLLPVFATPSMIALMEQTAAESVEALLEENQTTVGTKLEIAHTAATPVGMTVICETELTRVDRKKLVFRVTARDAAGPIGEGIHERFIVDKTKFMQKALEKREATR